MADAGDHVTSEVSSQSAFHNSRRAVLPPLVNEYCACTLSRVINWKTSDPAASTPILSIPSTGADFNSLYFVLPYAAYAYSTHTAFPFTNNTFGNLKFGSTLVNALSNIYDEYRVRTMKLEFEPVLTQPLINYPPLEAFVWYVPNPFNVTESNLPNEYDTFDTLRNDMKDNWRIARLSYQFGRKFSFEFVPHVWAREEVGGIADDHIIPYPWTDRAKESYVMYTPIVVFRRPFGNAANYNFSVTMKACVEFRGPNPNDEN